MRPEEPNPGLERVRLQLRADGLRAKSPNRLRSGLHHRGYLPNFTLSEILKGRKQFTATQANRMLGRTGETFWQTESFDHWIRDDAEKSRIRRYIRNNPVQAGLCAAPEDWPWGSAWQGTTTASPS